MPEELGTKEVLEQVDIRLGNVEQNLRAFRSEMNARVDQVHRAMNGRFDQVYQERGGLRSAMNGRFDQVHGEMNGRFARQTPWLVGLILLTWSGLMVSIWLKP